MYTMTDFIQTFKDDYSFRLEVDTVDHYIKAVEELFAYCAKPLDEITTRDIRSWLSHLETNGNKPGTLKKKLSGVKTFFKYCLEEKIIHKNPVASVPLPKILDSLPRYIQIEQLNQLRKLVEGDKKERALIEILCSTGIRISELVAMKKEDIDWSERIIHIPNGKNKKARMVTFTQSCGVHLMAYLNERSDDLPFVLLNPFGTGPVNKKTIQWKFKQYSRQLGLSITPHTLRHTFAAHLAIKGMPLSNIQVLLGHQSPELTQLYARLYNHARKQKYDELM